MADVSNPTMQKAAGHKNNREETARASTYQRSTTEDPVLWIWTMKKPKQGQLLSDVRDYGQASGGVKPFGNG